MRQLPASVRSSLPLLTGAFCILLIMGMVPFWLGFLSSIAGFAATIILWRRFRSGFVWPLVLTLVAVASAAPWTAPLVVRGSEQIAGNTPYCIQVAEGGDYREAHSWQDFSSLVMRAHRENGLAMQFHAILAVGAGPVPDLYNWSYRAMGWTNASRSHAPPVVSCLPRQFFAGNLPYIAFAPDPDVVRLRLLGRSFTMLSSYQPRAHAYDNPYLMLTVDLPTFGPPDAACSQPRTCVNQWATIYLQPASVMSWLDGPSTDRTRIVDESAGPSGSIRTRIECYPAGFNGGWNCEHRFLFDGVLFTFRMREAELAEWRLQQSRFIALFQALQQPR